MASLAPPSAQTFHLQPFSSLSQDFHLKALIELQTSVLQVQFFLQGDLSQLVIPAKASQSARKDKLWEHTCFECFWGASGSTAYRELNLSPAGHWALYRFSDYRKGTQVENAIESLTMERLDSTHELKIGFHVPHLLNGAGVEISLTTVLEHRDGSRSYWALEHGSEKPDFHLRKSFVIRY